MGLAMLERGQASRGREEGPECPQPGHWLPKALDTVVYRDPLVFGSFAFRVCTAEGWKDLGTGWALYTVYTWELAAAGTTAYSQ